MKDLKEELSRSNLKNDDKVLNQRIQLVQDTEERIAAVRTLTLNIENTLLEEIRNLNEIIAKKDAEIAFLIEADKRQLQENEEIQNSLKAHIRRLQDKIFVIQRECEIQLFTTVDRLTQSSKDKTEEMQANFDRISENYRAKINDLND